MPTALIAGAGIAGTAAALGFARAGWRADIFEQAPALGEVGAGLQLSPNACKVLHRLGVLPDIRARANAPEAAEMRDGLTGELIYRAPLGAAAEARWGGPYLHIHRADLLDVLAGAASQAGVGLELGRSATGAVSRPDGAALHLGDGIVRQGDVVIGADGIRSRAAQGDQPGRGAPLRRPGRLARPGAGRGAGQDAAADRDRLAGPRPASRDLPRAGRAARQLRRRARTRRMGRGGLVGAGRPRRASRRLCRLDGARRALLEAVEGCFLLGSVRPPRAGPLDARARSR